MSFSNAINQHTKINWHGNMKNKAKILVVEDNDLNLKLFCDLLKKRGFNVVSTKDGNKAIDLIIAESPKLIIMDIQLHGVLGLDIIKQIKSNKTLAAIPIIVVTAFAMKEDKDKILKTGCEGYITKPISIEPFLQTVENILLKKYNK